MYKFFKRPRVRLVDVLDIYFDDTRVALQREIIGAAAPTRGFEVHRIVSRYGNPTEGSRELKDMLWARAREGFTAAWKDRGAEFTARRGDSRMVGRLPLRTCNVGAIVDRLCIEVPSATEILLPVVEKLRQDVSKPASS